MARWRNNQRVVYTPCHDGGISPGLPNLSLVVRDNNRWYSACTRWQRFVVTKGVTVLFYPEVLAVYGGRSRSCLLSLSFPWPYKDLWHCNYLKDLYKGNRSVVFLDEIDKVKENRRILQFDCWLRGRSDEEMRWELGGLQLDILKY